MFTADTKNLNHSSQKRLSKNPCPECVKLSENASQHVYNHNSQRWKVRKQVPQLKNRLIADLKVLTNEKRGGLKVVSFDRSRFKLFTLRFSNKSVQALSCEGPKTAQRSLFLSFEINYCFQITALCRDASHFAHNTLH